MKTLTLENLKVVKGGDNPIVPSENVTVTQLGGGIGGAKGGGGFGGF